jgi:hypothetical protein
MAIFTVDSDKIAAQTAVPADLENAQVFATKAGEARGRVAWLPGSWKFGTASPAWRPQACTTSSAIKGLVSDRRQGCGARLRLPPVHP